MILPNHKSHDSLKNSGVRCYVSPNHFGQEGYDVIQECQPGSRGCTKEITCEYYKSQFWPLFYYLSQRWGIEIFGTFSRAKPDPLSSLPYLYVHVPGFQPIDTLFKFRTQEWGKNYSLKQGAIMRTPMQSTSYKWNTKAKNCFFYNSHQMATLIAAKVVSFRNSWLCTNNWGTAVSKYFDLPKEMHRFKVLWSLNKQRLVQIYKFYIYRQPMLSMDSVWRAKKNSRRMNARLLLSSIDYGQLFYAFNSKLHFPPSYSKNLSNVPNPFCSRQTPATAWSRSTSSAVPQLIATRHVGTHLNTGGLYFWWLTRGFIRFSVGISSQIIILTDGQNLGEIPNTHPASLWLSVSHGRWGYMSCFSPVVCDCGNKLV